MNLYCQPKFSRGTGLGNRLFSWARCRIFARQSGAKMISPLWIRPAFGPILRGGIAYRYYIHQILLADLFVDREGDISLFEGFYKTINAACISENEFFESSEIESKIIFDQADYNFRCLNGWNGFLLEELRKITKPKHLAFADAQGNIPIGVNVRCGNDFRRAPKDANYDWVGWLQKTPISWFVETINLIREEACFPVKAVIVSDGKENDLRGLLELENVELLRPGNAVTDLLVLTKSRVLLASSTSTFSAWACFLGQMPTINAPGHSMTEWGIERARGQFVGEFNPWKPDSDFLQQAVQALGKLCKSERRAA